ncbi:Uncharacterized conserved protein, heparinase superfamily [Pseudidiomarina indica]|uniref:Uncharacterized conserved protein, heparinase superfamily n=1 Tax=Pseudidiomarina indica TaxID=1159017 RepID=A0A1G6AUF7_9GAMM|nr:heparinase II/III family protein [Pseudidiomarina indica]SDB12037.1 Uncharacterized conserved protein, heparinase superfamily [Pseudidiomarina indica]
MKLISKSLLLFRTVRHLRLRQVAFQLFYRIRVKPKVATSQSVALRDSKKGWEGELTGAQSFFPPYTFEFLNKKENVSTREAWNNHNLPKLWLYNLHYFDDLNAPSSNERTSYHRDLVLRWITENPVMHGNGWEPYPLSLRIVNWIKWLKRFPEMCESAVLSSLHTQTKALEKQLEFHILANHLFANIKALIFAGYFFKGPEAERWLKKGLDLLSHELSEQFLPDGAHYERSPMYHCILIWDVLDLICLLRDSDSNKKIVTHLVEVAQRGVGWLEKMLHPDGDIPFFNDSTFGIAPTFYSIKKYATELNISSQSMPLNESGFAVLKSKKLHMIMDIGEIAPTYQPGHAHAAVSSFELSAFGKRVFVNSGISEYGISAERSFQRSSAAHNTVTAIVAAKEISSSEMWSGFRVARRSKVNSSALARTVTCEVEGFYDGSKKCRHRRHVMLSEEDEQLIILDNLYSVDSARAYFYLHPDWGIRVEGGIVYISDESHVIKVEFKGDNMNVINEPAYWNCGFGKQIENQRIVVEFTSKLGMLITL